MKTLIFDKNAGFLQHVSNLEDNMEALKEFDASVGIDPHGKGLDLDEWMFFHVTDTKASEVKAWQDRGAPASEWPLD